MDNNLLSLNKLKNEIMTAKLLSFCFTKEQKDRVTELEKQINEIEDTITLFNNYFVDLGWCAYDSMDIRIARKAINAYEKSGANCGERVLLDYYQTDVKEKIHWLKNKAKPFSDRNELIQKAFEDHFEKRFFASVPQFLIIIDGSINDYTKSKGFFAENTDLSVWDCIVGCSDGLAKLRDIITKNRTKTNQDEIRIPYRNGILHGRDLNYGNEYVSCKCVSLLFTLADWMSLKSSEEVRKDKFAKESNPPPISESIKRIHDSKLAQKEISQWKKRIVIVGKDIPSTPSAEDCSEYPYLIPLINMFDAWKIKNYGHLAQVLKNVFNPDDTEKKIAGECRKLFQDKDFCSYEIKIIDERGCALTNIQVQVNWDSNDKHFSELWVFGSLYKDEEGNFGLPWRNNGSWQIVFWSTPGLR